MAALRAIVLLLAVSAVCAGKISGSVRATGVQRAVNEATRHIDSQIAEIENYGVITDVIDEGLEKLKELVEKIKEKVQGAEAALLKAIKKATENVAERLNNLIEKATGLDLHLEDKLEDFEKKTENCANELRDKVRKTLLAIKTDAETCAAPQIAEAKKLTQEIRKLIELIESVPVNTVNSIKQCVNPKPITTTTPVPETTTTPVPETTTTPVPETTTPAEPETTTPAEPETTTPAEPETTTPAEPETTTPAEPETTTPAEPETTTPAQPETTTPAQPETTTAQADDAGEATTLAPQDDQSDVASNVVVVDFSNRKPSLHGISDIFEKVKCVTEALAKAVVDLKDAPKLVYYLDKEIRDLASKETQKTLKKCAVQAVSGRGKELQTDAAELAYCLIAPSSSSDSDESGEH